MFLQHQQNSDDSLDKMCYVLDCSMPAGRSIVARAAKLLASMSVSIELTSVTFDKLRSTICAY